MNARRISCTLLLVPLLSCPLSAASDGPPVKLEAAFLIYSYDFNQIYGEQAVFTYLSFRISSQYLKVDLARAWLYAYGRVEINTDKDRYQGDVIWLDLRRQALTLINYGDTITSTRLAGEENTPPMLDDDSIEQLTLARLRNSFLYFTGQKMDITGDRQVIGYLVNSYLEGAKSVGFKKLNLTKGLDLKIGGFSLNRIWYTKSQGLIAHVSYEYDQKDKANSLTQVFYEEHTLAKNYVGLERQFNIMSSTSISLSKKQRISFAGNFDSSRYWSAQFLSHTKWSDKLSTQIDLVHNNREDYGSETWIGLQSASTSGVGDINLNARFEMGNQALLSLAYRKAPLRNLDLNIMTTYSKLSIGQLDTFSKIFTGLFSLAYSGGPFNLAADYFLNRDLLGDQMFSRPQISFGIRPLALYHDLLTLNFRNIVFINRIASADAVTSSYNNNIVFSLSAAPIHFQKGFYAGFNVAVEQFLEKNRRNFTSAGIIFQLHKALFNGVSLEGYYSAQSRRKTKNWFIEGTTSQDLSTALRFDFSKRLAGWITVSYDPKDNRWRQSFADVSVGVLQNWKVHALANYDFLRRKLNNIDLYVIRQAGRFQLRFIWRSLSKQILVELVPG